MQELWKLNLGWDDIIPPFLSKAWNEFVSRLPSLSEIKLKRFIIICWVSVMEKGYSAVVYLRGGKLDKQGHITLLMAKTRVAPIKTVSIPRLELLGAVLLTKLIGNVFESLSKCITISSVYAWSDSTVHFNPPAAAHFGGLWEANMKVAKNILRRIIGERSLTFEELSTVFARVEATLNSLPLTALSNDPNELEALSPGHLLIGAPLFSTPDSTTIEFNCSRLSRWQLVRQITQHFWQRSDITCERSFSLELSEIILAFSSSFSAVLHSFLLLLQLIPHPQNLAFLRFALLHLLAAAPVVFKADFGPNG
ncbi:hypothetical protein J437_LFUL019192 [Ladona fulva]|uniref:Uncharacterized protein n=1 Tax=Ladona fulva TaxID=123851 RepID=A0A8K0P5D9_LADFU|nr:hypothetical protein J437_LFUL019192 [Ladona fulva]